MPITWRVGGDGRRIEIVFTDPYSIPESERVMKEIFARPESVIALTSFRS